MSAQFRAPATSRGREGWFCDQLAVRDGRVSGRMWQSAWEHGNVSRPARVVRKTFTVGLAADGTFQADIGTGSGVKVRFRLPEELRP